MWVCTSINPGRQVARDRSIAEPADPEAGATEVMTPSPSKVTTWSESSCPDRTSRSLPQRTDPGAALAAAEASAHTPKAIIHLRIEESSRDSYGKGLLRIPRVRRTAKGPRDSVGLWPAERAEEEHQLPPLLVGQALPERGHRPVAFADLVEELPVGLGLEARSIGQVGRGR